MLDPAWAFTPPILWFALAAMLAWLVIRSVRKDRREYQRFKRYRTTRKRQQMFRKWLLESFLTFGGLALVLLLLASGFVAPLLLELQAWPLVSDVRSFDPAILWGVIGGLVLGTVGVTVAALLAARKEDELTAVGDIAAMLPRNRQELRLGALMSINAGIFEELVFRLAIPALVFGASGSAILAVVFSVLLFGALHIYQGVAGVVGTAVVGGLMMFAYAASGLIIVPIVLHALFDLRSLVLIPMVVKRVHLVDGTKQPYLPRPTAKPVPVDLGDSEPVAGH